MQVLKSVTARLLFAVVGMFFSLLAHAVQATYTQDDLTTVGNYSVNPVDVFISAEAISPDVTQYSVLATVGEAGNGVPFPSAITSFFLQTSMAFTATDVIGASQPFTVGLKDFDEGSLYGITFSSANAWFTTRFAPGLASFRVGGGNGLDAIQNSSFGNLPPDGPLDGSVKDYGIGPMASPVPEMPISVLMALGLAFIGLTTTTRRRT